MNTPRLVALLWLLVSFAGFPALVFAQEEQPSPTPTPPKGGGGSFTINLPTPDWTKVISDWMNGLGNWWNNSLTTLGNKIWNSGVNVVGHTDPNLTFNLGPIQLQLTSMHTGLLAILTAALVLIGFKSILASVVSSHSDIVSEIIDHVLMSVVYVTVFPLALPVIYNALNGAAQSLGTGDYSQYLSTSIPGEPIIQAVFTGILLFFVFRLFTKGGWRLGYLAIMTPVGLLAAAVYAIPPLRWLWGWWANRYFGILFAQALSVLALTIGIQFVANGGVFSYFFALAFVQLATEIYDIFGRTGEHRSYGAPWAAAAGLVTSFLPTGGGAAAAGVAAGAAGASTTVANTAESADSAYGY